MTLSQIVSSSQINRCRLSDLEGILESIIVIDDSDQEFIDAVKVLINAHDKLTYKREVNTEIQRLQEIQSRM